MEATTSDPRARWAAAVGEFNAGHYFEAHEIWECLWDEAVDEEKNLLQAMVQIAAAYTKLAVHEVNGARKLFERGLERLTRVARTAPHGLDLGALRAMVEDALARLRALPWGARVGLEAVPRPHLPT